mgnify:CR=1 FL=1
MIIEESKIQEDRKRAELWEAEGKTKTTTVDEIVELAKHEIRYCDDYCYSREYTGEDRCICIRERFVSPKHFELYLTARKKFKEMIAAKALAVAVSDD